MSECEAPTRVFLLEMDEGRPPVDFTLSSRRPELPPNQLSEMLLNLRNSTSRRRVYLLIVLAVLVAHGLLLINRGVFWDDWLVKGFLDDGNWHLLRNMTSEMGLPILAYFFGAVKFLGLSDYAKIIALVLILGAAIAVYEIGVRCSFLSQKESFAIAVLSAIYPAYQTAVLLTTLQYLFFYFLFLLAVLLHILADTVDGPTSRRTCLRAFGTIAFYISFNLNSLLVFYFPFLALLFLVAKDSARLTLRELAHLVTIKRLYLILLPFVYWSVKKLFFPSHGLYEKYNTLDLNVAAVSERVRYSIEVATAYHLRQSALALMDRPILWMVVLMLAALFYAAAIRMRVRTQSSPARVTSGSGVILFLCALSLLISGIFPYAAAGIVPGTSGWNSRHALLYGLPVAILIVTASRCFQFPGPLSAGKSQFQFGMLRTLFLTTIAIAFALCSIDYYVAWQARAIKDQAIMGQLRSKDELRSYSIYWVDDNFPAGGEPYYNYYEWSSMFKKVWGGQSRIAMQLKYQGRPIQHDLPPSLVFTNRYNLEDFNPEGRQVCLNVEPGYPDMSQGRLVSRYLRLRAKELFTGRSEPSRSGDFVLGSVRLHATPLLETETKVDPAISCRASNASQ